MKLIMSLNPIKPYKYVFFNLFAAQTKAVDKRISVLETPV